MYSKRDVELESLQRRAERAERAIQRAASIHKPYEDSEHCKADDEPWPCRTFTALVLDNPHA
jgi:hypothetical protein